MMKVLLVFLAIITYTQAKFSVYKEIIKEDKVGQLFLNYIEEFNLRIIDRDEFKKRFEIFKHNVEVVAEENAVDDETAEFNINKFSVLTDEERKSKTTGVNTTRALEDIATAVRKTYRPLLGSSSSPEEHFWTDEGAVTPVQDQGWCGSCTIFSAVATIETNYKIATGNLRKFSEQEVLDCVYEKKKTWYRRSSCYGGLVTDAIQYVIDSGRLSSAALYPYTEVEKMCRGYFRGKKKYNGLIMARVQEIAKVDNTEEAHIEALKTSAISVTYQVTDRFYGYERGIYKDVTKQCANQRAIHAMTMIGYAAEYTLVKNSWGTDWGDKGFVKFTRGHYNCGLYQYSLVPVMKLKEKINGNDRMKADMPTDYNPRHSDPTDDCQDEQEDCQLHFCFDDTVSYRDCRRTCHTCGVDFDAEEAEEAQGECGNGLERCDDGVCRHRHACGWITVAPAPQNSKTY